MVAHAVVVQVGMVMGVSVGVAVGLDGEFRLGFRGEYGRQISPMVRSDGSVRRFGRVVGLGRPVVKYRRSEIQKVIFSQGGAIK